MSVENAKAFFQRMREDSEFRNKLGSHATKDEAHPILEEEGYEFTDEEAKIAIEEFSAVGEDGELSDEQLEAVAGGCHVFNQKPVVASCHIHSSISHKSRKSSESPNFEGFRDQIFGDRENY